MFSPQYFLVNNFYNICSSPATTKTSGRLNDCFKYAVKIRGQYFLNWIKQAFLRLEVSGSSWNSRPWSILMKRTFRKGQRQLLRHRQRLSPCKMDCSPDPTLPTLHPSRHLGPSIAKQSLPGCHLSSRLDWERISNERYWTSKNNGNLVPPMTHNNKNIYQKRHKCFTETGKKYE